MHEVEKERWLVVYVSSRQEKKVARILTDRGVEHYLPMARKLRQWSDRKKWVDFPLFNGYLFVRPDPAQFEWIPGVPGVVNYLRFSGKPAVVTEKEIEIIRSIESAGYYAESLLTPEDFDRGDTVCVLHGPLKGQKGQLLRKNNEQIFLVSFDTLGQSLKVNIPYELLGKAVEQE
ncbi:MAG: UpxY family transcription antiterminator [Flavobacteriales bacterium]|nr:UpxY family transcription antiterminator [Flavobacteriales bacterium]